MIRVIGVGDCFVDRYLFQNTMYPGGNSVNFAVYARMLGHESAFCGNLAQDVYAGMILDALDAWGIEHEHCRILPDGETGHGSIQLVNGDRVISDDNDNGSAKRDPLPITPELLQYLRGFDLIHSACYGFLEPQLPRLSCAGVPIAFDCSENWVDEGYLNAVAPYCSIILFSGSAYPRQLLLRRMRQACVLGCDIAIGTVGAQGALVWDGQQLYELAPYRAVGGILDTTGAGDSFFTGFCTTYIEGRKQLMALLDQGAFDLCAQDHASFRAALILLSSVLSDCVTAFAGPISFVGIAVPHLMKSLFKSAEPLIMIPASFLGGGVFCLLCDLIARTAFAPTEVSISSVTAVFGAPVVIYMMIHRKAG